MICAPWDLVCNINAAIEPTLEILWLFIQISAFVFPATIIYLITRKVYSGRYFEINAIFALWAGYAGFFFAGYLAAFAALAGIAVLLLAIFTPLGGIMIAWLISKLGGGGGKHG